MVLSGKLRERNSLKIPFMIIIEDDVAWFGSLQVTGKILIPLVLFVPLPLLPFLSVSIFVYFYLYSNKYPQCLLKDFNWFQHALEKVRNFANSLSAACLCNFMLSRPDRDCTEMQGSISLYFLSLSSFRDDQMSKVWAIPELLRHSAPQCIKAWHYHIFKEEYIGRFFFCFFHQKIPKTGTFHLKKKL